MKSDIDGVPQVGDDEFQQSQAGHPELPNEGLCFGQVLLAL
jgi:hypothetical protein